MNLIQGSFGAKAPKPTPLRQLLAHTSYVERKRQEDRRPEGLPPDGSPSGFKAMRIDTGGDDAPESAVLISMEGSRCSLVVAGVDLNADGSTCLSVHNGEKVSVMETGAVALHLSCNMTLRFASEMLNALLPRMVPSLAAAATKFLEEVRSEKVKQDASEKSIIINPNQSN